MLYQFVQFLRIFCKVEFKQKILFLAFWAILVQLFCPFWGLFLSVFWADSLKFPRNLFMNRLIFTNLVNVPNYWRSSKVPIITAVFTFAVILANRDFGRPQKFLQLSRVYFCYFGPLPVLTGSRGDPKRINSHYCRIVGTNSYWSSPPIVHQT